MLTPLLSLIILAQATPVRSGLDMLARDGFEPLQGARVGLVTNHSGVDSTGKSKFRLQSRGNRPYVIESSRLLPGDWTPLITHEMPCVTNKFTTPVPPPPWSQYYRAVELP